MFFMRYISYSAAETSAFHPQGELARTGTGSLMTDWPQLCSLSCPLLTLHSSNLSIVSLYSNGQSPCTALQIDYCSILRNMIYSNIRMFSRIYLYREKYYVLVHYRTGHYTAVHV